MFCDQCGAENREQAKFCIKCGANIFTGNSSSLSNDQVSSVVIKPLEPTVSIRKNASSKTDSFLTLSFKEFPAKCKISDINSSTFSSNGLNNFGKTMGLVIGFIVISTVYGLLKQHGGYNSSPILMFIILSIAISIFQSFLNNQETSRNNKIISEMLNTMVNVDCRHEQFQFKIATNYVDEKLYEDIIGKSFLSIFTSKSKFIEFKSAEKKKEFCEKLNTKFSFLVEKGFHFEVVTQAHEKIATDVGIKLVNATNPNYLRLILVENI